MIKLEAVDVIIVRGNVTSITDEKRITGHVKFVSHSDGTSSLMLPVSNLLDAQREARKRGIIEPRPLGRSDMSKREIISLGKLETKKVIKSSPGDELVFIRKGWGRTWHQRFILLEK